MLHAPDACLVFQCRLPASTAGVRVWPPTTSTLSSWHGAAREQTQRACPALYLSKAGLNQTVKPQEIVWNFTTFPRNCRIIVSGRSTKMIGPHSPRPQGMCWGRNGFAAECCGNNSRGLWQNKSACNERQDAPSVCRDVVVR